MSTVSALHAPPLTKDGETFIIVIVILLALSRPLDLRFIQIAGTRQFISIQKETTTRNNKKKQREKRSKLKACASLTGSNSNHSIQPSGKMLRDKSRSISISFHQSSTFPSVLFIFLFCEWKTCLEKKKTRYNSTVTEGLRDAFEKCKWPPFFFISLSLLLTRIKAVEKSGVILSLRLWKKCRITDTHVQKKNKKARAK